MNDTLELIFGFAILFLACAGAVYLLTVGSEREAVMQEAFDRGYAVQCIGKEGYYWECG